MKAIIIRFTKFLLGRATKKAVFVFLLVHLLLRITPHMSRTIMVKTTSSKIVVAVTWKGVLVKYESLFYWWS